MFYNSITAKNITHIIPPSKEQVTTFWKNIWNNSVSHDHTATWIQSEKQEYEHLDETQNVTITVEELKNTIKKTHNWKGPGTDSIHNYWYKQLISIHKPLADAINEILHQPAKTPSFLTEGITYIKPKCQQTQDPSNYRPITCLPTLYKIITAILTHKIDTHLQVHNILTEEQKGCRKKNQGCKEQLIIDSTVMKQAEKDQRNLFTCYIDYKKAFDSIPHTWLLHVLEIYKIPKTITQFLTYTMKTWRTSIHLTTDNPNTDIHTEEIKIKRGIFQGDSLSALWFCLSLNPLSKQLNKSPSGFNIKNRTRIQHKINHLMYMDDIKLYGATASQITNLIKITENISRDIVMEFGIEKCKILRMERGRWTENENIQIMNQEYIENMQEHETYKYLGFQQNTKLNHTKIKTELTQKYKSRLTTILNTKLNAKNIVKAINTFAIPLLTYSFGIIKWTQTDTESINRLNRTMLTKHKMQHPKSAIQRTTLPRKLGGRGLIDITELHTKQINNLRTYFKNKNNSSLHKAIVKADQNYTPLNLSQQHETTNDLPDKLTQWGQKSIHGRHYKIINQPHINKELTNKWLTQGQLHPETEGFTIAIQDEVIATLNYKKHIIKDQNITTDNCRRCHQYSETIDHIISGCKLLAGTDYTERHNIAAKIIHQEIAINHKLLTEKQPYYKYQPTTILENEHVKLYWDTTLHTDRTVSHNRPDITYTLKQQKTTFFIDIAIPSASNLEKKEEEKIEKYTPLAIEIKDIWKQDRVAIVPIIISPTGVTPHSLTKNMQKINIQPSIHTHLQKAVIIKTCNIVRKFLEPFI